MLTTALVVATRFVDDGEARADRHMTTLNLKPKLSFRFTKGPKRKAIKPWDKTSMGLAKGSWGYLDFETHEKTEKLARARRAKAREVKP